MTFYFHYTNLTIISFCNIELTMGIQVKVNSILGGGLLISLIAYFGGIHTHNPSLSEAAWPFVILFVAVWGIFIALTIIRNISSL